MKLITTTRAAAAITLLTCSMSNTCRAALTTEEGRYLDQLLSNNPGQQRRASEALAYSANNNPEILDVVAEILLQKYQDAKSGYVRPDSLAWLCKVLGTSGNGRYRVVVAKVAYDLPVRNKVHGYCAKAAKQLPKDGTPGYQQGTVNLEAQRAASEARHP